MSTSDIILFLLPLGLYLLWLIYRSAVGKVACGVGTFEDPAMVENTGCNPDREAVLYVTAVGK